MTIEHRYIQKGEWVRDVVSGTYKRIVDKGDDWIRADSDIYLSHQGAYYRLEPRGDRIDMEKRLDRIDPTWRLNIKL